MNGKKNQNEQLKMRSEDVYKYFEGIDEEVESRRVASNISHGGSNKCNTPKYTLVVFNMFRVFCRYNLNFS